MNDHISAEDFAAYLDGMLRPENKTELENHFSNCPACLDELLEIAEITRSRKKIPTEFLTKALGEKKVSKSVLPLRLVFEVAAALVVVVFIGYLFLDNNRFWQIPEQQKTSIVSDKAVQRKDAAVPAGAGEMAPQLTQKRGRDEADVDQRFADAIVFAKRKSAVGDKGAPTAIAGAAQTRTQENQLQEIAAKQPQPVAEKINLEKKELARTETAPAVVGAVQMDFASKDQTAAKVMAKKAGKVEQNLEEPGAGVALPIEANFKENKLKDEEATLQSSVARKEIAAKKTLPPINIEGDVAWADLRNPELLSAWSWLQKGLALELQIDSAGCVTAAVALGKFEPLAAVQAEKEAGKLLFAVSKKKLRRARLSVD
jgi:hypothetical protein